MAQQSFANLAVLVALAFAIMALHSCASSKQSAQVHEPVMAAPRDATQTTPEFHGAPIGRDALRSRLESDA